MYPYLVLLRMGFSLPLNVATNAVRSYRTFSPLPVPCDSVLASQRWCRTYTLRDAYPGLSRWQRTLR